MNQTERRTTTTLIIRPDYRPTDFHQLQESRRHNSDHNIHQHHTANIFFLNIIRMADKHNIPNGKMHSNCRLLSYHIVCKITQRNNVRREIPCDPVFKFLNDEITPSRNASVSINGKNGEILLRTWTKRQILPSGGELSKELTAEQNSRQRTKLLPSRNLVLIVQAASHQVQPTVQHFKARQTLFFKRNPISNKGDQEETNGDG